MSTRGKVILIVLLTGVFLLLLQFIPLSCLRCPKEYHVEEGTWETEAIEPSDEEVEISISVCDNASAIDLYIMKLEDFSNNIGLKENFTVPDGRWFHGVTQEDITFDPPDDESYIIVLDNSDNVLANDTIPQGDVIVELNVKYTESETPMTIKGIVISLFAVIFVIYTLILFFKKKRAIERKRFKKVM